MTAGSPPGEVASAQKRTEREGGKAGLMDARHVRGSTLLLAGRGLSLLLNMATQVAIVRTLSKTEFGAFAYALALTAAGRTVLSLGQGKLLSRFMAKYEEERDYPRMFGAMALAAATIVATSTVLIAGLYMFADRLAGTAIDDPRAIHVLLILVFLAPMEALDEVFVSLFAVFSRPQSIFFRKNLFTPGLRLAVVVALFATGGDAWSLAVGYVTTGAIGLSVYALLFTRILKQRGLWTQLHANGLVLPYRSVLSFSLPTLTSEFVWLSMHTASVTILGFHHGVTQVAGYRAVWPAARLNGVVFTTFVTLFLPMASRLHARNQHHELSEAYWHTAIFLAVFTFPIFAMTGPFAEQTTVALFGTRYTASAPILTTLAVGYYINAALGFNAYTLQIFGRLRTVVAINLTAAATNLGLSALLVPHLGALGVAWANGITITTLNLCNQTALARCMHNTLIDRRYLRAYLTITATAATLFAIQHTLRPNLLTALTITATAWTTILALTQHQLRLQQSFPELTRIPLLRNTLTKR